MPQTKLKTLPDVLILAILLRQLGFLIAGAVVVGSHNSWRVTSNPGAVLPINQNFKTDPALL